MALPEIVPTPTWSGDWDAVVVVGPGPDSSFPSQVGAAWANAVQVDRQVGRKTCLLVVEGAPGSRLIHAPVGPLEDDWDDVRRFAEAAARGIKRARDAGAIRPLLVVQHDVPREGFAKALPVALLGAMGALWEPLEAREAHGAAIESIRRIGFVAPSGDNAERVAEWVAGLEAGRRLARDVCGTEPERMAPPRLAQLCMERFAGTSISVEVISQQAILERDYPLLSAVGRASRGVARHAPRVIRLQYDGEGPIERTLMFAGKGVTYDTGGADLKVGGHMAGMSRDKGGAAAVIGLMEAARKLRPKGLRLVAEIGAVRNSIGADAFVTDEIITAHSGARVRIGNTDAEGRLVMADLLSHCRSRAAGHPAPQLFTVATLTGHAALAVGPYTIAMDNGPAQKAGVATGLAAAGEAIGDPFHISTLRREDIEFVLPRTSAADVLSANNKPSSSTPRGHQYPMAFLLVASGLSRHGLSSSAPLPYTHIDIAGSGVEKMDWAFGKPTGAPVAALVTRYFG